ncbi:MAG TPA: amylo-alpha-1,6-glucosidase [Methylomirabilota bacterium]|nr:amylo-alpha-1,6-glucosidase [Methylomirabilota bacterium]
MRRRIVDANGFALIALESRSGVRAEFLPTGALFALRHGSTLINQLLPGPAEEGLSRLLVRWGAHAGRGVGGDGGWAPLVGPGLAFARAGRHAVTWETALPGPLAAQTTFMLHPQLAGWRWRVRLRNGSRSTVHVDVLHAQDLGLADEAAVRNNEAYVSQYLDLLPIADPRLGWIILARQNEAMNGGRHPWLAVGCATGAAAFCTDGWQFFGDDHRLSGEPGALRTASLPSRRLQYECALAGLQSRGLELPPGAGAEIAFFASYVADHPAASDADDARRVHELIGARWRAASPRTRESAGGSTSVFTHARWLHGAAPTVAEWEAWFPGIRRHEERAGDGTLLAFFHGADTHVVARAKEAAVLRPHGHVLRSGEPRWVDAGHLGVTCYAAGIFAAQVYVGNPNLARLLSVVRNQLNVARASGMRVFVRERGEWRQLGVPSAFAMTPRDVRWIYRLDDGVVEARVWCAARRACAFLELRVTAGSPREFLVTHALALGGNEFDRGGELVIHDAAAWTECGLAPDSVAAQHLAGLCFAIAAAEPAAVAALGGDELVYADGLGRGGPYAVMQTKVTSRCGVVLVGSLDGPTALSAAVTAARREYADGAPEAGALDPPIRLAGTTDPAVDRVDEILPWFTHNAGIHFSAPHGLEQYGGAAWGVRDVCQGSIEWLLAAGEVATARRLLATVFAQQYPHGAWPQWFMHRPFHASQQPHSHGDVCFWPVKALADYVEATNDLQFVGEEIGYTDPERFEPTGVRESLWAHCDRVIEHCAARFAPGTSLVNYGDGDWDDTLQPADPAMRTRMVSAWTVALAYQTFRQLADVCRRGGEDARASRLDVLLDRMRADFHRHLMPGGTVAGFVVREDDGTFRPLLHPTDRVTGIRYRLLPMTRAVLAELFTPDEARHHLDIVARELRFPDGVRLMSEPSAYHGGRQRLFRRADTAANVGREIGLMYVHAHLRYAEAMAKTGDADALWWALQVANPVGLTATVPHAAPRQSNVYFSSSDADFPDRLEAAARWSELRTGDVAVRGGWRLYSSGPGLYLHAIRAALLGVRESFGEVVFDPVLPRSLDGLAARVRVYGRPVEIRYRVRGGGQGPSRITVNGARIPLETREANPYRPGGWRVPVTRLALTDATTAIEIEL